MEPYAGLKIPLGYERSKDAALFDRSYPIGYQIASGSVPGVFGIRSDTNVTLLEEVCRFGKVVEAIPDGLSPPPRGPFAFFWPIAVAERCIKTEHRVHAGIIFYLYINYLRNVCSFFALCSFFVYTLEKSTLSVLCHRRTTQHSLKCS
jgi:hypothetical protein